MRSDDVITVVIADDHEMVREGIKNYFETQADIKITGEAATGTEAVHIVRKTRPMVVLLDLKMPEMSGIEVCREIKKVNPETQIIILTSYHEDRDIFTALEAGALSYLLKDVKAAELLRAIRYAVKGEAVLHPSVTTRMITKFRDDGTVDASPFKLLSKREMEILIQIAKGLSNRDIAESLFISIGTVKGHVGNILDKLQLSDRTQAAVYAWRKGVIKREE